MAGMSVDEERDISLASLLNAPDGYRLVSEADGTGGSRAVVEVTGVAEQPARVRASIARRA
jgi:hypothetical protein